tara:strand:- start:371 stop:508 length:138 start_codon:yes stop_codon:yes gene_type:complete
MLRLSSALLLRRITAGANRPGQAAAIAIAVEHHHLSRLTVAAGTA